MRSKGVGRLGELWGGWKKKKKKRRKKKGGGGKKVLTSLFSFLPPSGPKSWGLIHFFSFFIFNFLLLILLLSFFFSGLWIHIFQYFLPPLFHGPFCILFTMDCAVVYIMHPYDTSSTHNHVWICHLGWTRYPRRGKSNHQSRLHAYQ